MKLRQVAEGPVPDRAEGAPRSAAMRTSKTVATAAMLVTLGLAALSWVIAVRQMNGMSMGLAARPYGCRPRAPSVRGRLDHRRSPPRHGELPAGRHPPGSALHARGHGRVHSVVFGRWGDPDDSGVWGVHPFGFEVTGYATLEGVTIPSAGRAGWFYGTDRWEEGEFFRSEITDYHLVTEADG
jgi:hypothetical protein